MKIDYFKIPEIKVSYKDNVKTTERFQVKCSEDTVQICNYSGISLNNIESIFLVKAISVQ